MADSAFYINYKSQRTGDYDFLHMVKAYYELMNEFPFPQEACVQHYQSEAYKCFMAEYAVPFIKSPIFIIESAYDKFKIPGILQSPCTSLAKCSADNLEAIHKYYSYQREKMREIL